MVAKVKRWSPKYHLVRRWKVSSERESSSLGRLSIKWVHSSQKSYSWSRSLNGKVLGILLTGSPLHKACHCLELLQCYLICPILVKAFRLCRNVEYFTYFYHAYFGAWFVTSSSVSNIRLSVVTSTVLDACWRKKWLKKSVCRKVWGTCWNSAQSKKPSSFLSNFLKAASTRLSLKCSNIRYQNNHDNHPRHHGFKICRRRNPELDKTRTIPKLSLKFLKYKC